MVAECTLGETRPGDVIRADAKGKAPEMITSEHNAKTLRENAELKKLKDMSSTNLGKFPAASGISKFLDDRSMLTLDYDAMLLVPNLLLGGLKQTRLVRSEHGIMTHAVAENVRVSSPELYGPF
eukprot:CAMPEP_0196596152 /NCGR_PEP_ID=MMETSP1081-20130531/84412_1 /TAXON_ID=36882 /ORGANISM="Pyramimonas amylifera, Strain CCMP720" /LENGTH=123 /DNA_ID=CAMNT_0041921013 /DNA_START=90 /DNA_END=461 /DNA_ORIENTATION=-